MAYPQSLERAGGYYSSFFFVGIKYATEILETDTFSQKILQKKNKNKNKNKKKQEEKEEVRGGERVTHEVCFL